MRNGRSAQPDLVGAMDPLVVFFLKASRGQKTRSSAGKEVSSQEEIAPFSACPVQGR